MKIAIVGFYEDVLRYSSQLLALRRNVDNAGVFGEMRACSIDWPIRQGSALEKEIIQSASRGRWYEVVEELQDFILRRYDKYPTVTHLAIASGWLQNAVPSLQGQLDLPIITMADSLRQYFLQRFHCANVRGLGPVGFLGGNRLLDNRFDECVISQLSSLFPLVVGEKDWFETTSILGRELSPKRIRERNLKKLRGFTREQKVRAVILADIWAERCLLGLAKKEFLAFSYQADLRLGLYSDLEKHPRWPHFGGHRNPHKVALVSAEQTHISAVRQLCLDYIQSSEK